MAWSWVTRSNERRSHSAFPWIQYFVWHRLLGCAAARPGPFYGRYSDDETQKFDISWFRISHFQIALRRRMLTVVVFVSCLWAWVRFKNVHGKDSSRINFDYSNIFQTNWCFATKLKTFFCRFNFIFKFKIEKEIQLFCSDEALKLNISDTSLKIESKLAFDPFFSRIKLVQLFDWCSFLLVNVK